MEKRQSLLTFQSQDQYAKISSNVEVQKNQQAEKANSRRLDSLDILRGMTMAGMIIVDMRGPNAPWFIRHVSWDGLSPADLVFPSFLFIMGMAIPLAITAKKPLTYKNFLRVLILFAIGVFFNFAQEKFKEYEIPGVLQRLSICYLMTMIIHRLTCYAEKSLQFIGNLLAICIGLIYLTFMLTYQNPQIGCTHEKNLTRSCNFGGYFDYKILGKKFMAYPNDPQGFFTSLSAFLNCFIGYKFCLIMQENKNNLSKTLKIWTIFCLILAINVYPLTFVMTLNKKIWSISFVFLTSSITGLSLVLMTFIVDVLKYKNQKCGKIITFCSQPFLWLGRNPLAIYLIMSVIDILFNHYIMIGQQSFAQFICYYALEIWIGSKVVASTILPILYVIIFALIARILYKKGIFVRL